MIIVKIIELIGKCLIFRDFDFLQVDMMNPQTSLKHGGFRVVENTNEVEKSKKPKPLNKDFGNIVARVIEARIKLCES